MSSEMSNSMGKKQLQAILDRHGIWVRTFHEEGERADLREANLYGADLRGANLYGADLYGADLYEANLYGADLRGANLRGADLYEANLYRADLRGATLRGATLRGATLRGADLREADLREADLYGADLCGADLRGADLREADLRGADLDTTWVYQIGPIGSRRDQLVVLRHPDGVIEAQTGCFRGTLEDLEQAVGATHARHPQYLREYQAAIAYCRTVFAAHEDAEHQAVAE